MSYQLFYHPEVLKSDLKKITQPIQIRILRSLEEKLAVRPEAYGHPLARNLAGYWKLRVGDYRVVFKVIRNEIWIYAISHRKDIYSKILKRIS